MIIKYIYLRDKLKTYIKKLYIYRCVFIFAKGVPLKNLNLELVGMAILQ